MFVSVFYWGRALVVVFLASASGRDERKEKGGRWTGVPSEVFCVFSERGMGWDVMGRGWRFFFSEKWCRLGVGMELEGAVVEEGEERVVMDGMERFVCVFGGRGDNPVYPPFSPFGGTTSCLDCLCAFC